MDLVPCCIRGIFVAVFPAGASPVLVLDVDAETSLLIYIGLLEAVSINTALNNEISPRPMTHDLFCEFLNRYHVTLRSLYIDTLLDGVYYANLVLSRDGQEEIMDCRPSDGIAIAIRCKSDIFLERKVAELSGLHRTDLPPLTGLQAYLQG